VRAVALCFGIADQGPCLQPSYRPHDIEVRELGSGKSRKEQGEALGLYFTVAPKLPVHQGINAVRNLIPRCWFDQGNCRHGIEALKQYRAEYHGRLRTLRSTPRVRAITQMPSQWDWGKPLAYPDLGLAYSLPR
jgi:hypothetical protein